MSTFEVKARRLTITPHPDADALELAAIDDYRAVVRKGEFETGELIVYIPEQSVLPEWLIAELGLEGRLAGGTVLPDGSKLRDRVKAVRLRGQLSQGLVYRPNGRLGELDEGTDYAEELGVSKWSPPIPLHMAGEVKPVPGLRSYTDIENIKRFPDVLVPGEEVIAVEKAHGTCTVAGLVDGEFVVSSKGHASQGRALVENPGNVYWRMAERYALRGKLETLEAWLSGRESWPQNPLYGERVAHGSAIHLYGETLGVQDLMYGLPKGELDFRLFDIRIGDQFLDYDAMLAIAAELELPVLPVLYRGPFDRETIEEVARGKEQVSGQETGVREGVVVRPTTERSDPNLGRVILKVISPEYLLRKGGKDGEATEFE